MKRMILIVFCIFLIGCSWHNTDKALFSSFTALQAVNAGNMNWQQENDYYEINPIYGKHPSKDQIYTIKILETGIIYCLAEFFPKYRRGLLIGSNMMVIGFIIYDNKQGIDFKFNW